MSDKKAVFYYSLEGNTGRVAGIIAEKAGADIIEIKPVNDISPEGFSRYFWGGRQVIMKKKPEIEKLEHIPEDYEIIFIGTPVWAGSFAPALRSFFDHCIIKGKKIVLFCTHQGGIGGCLNKMEKELQGNEIIGKMDFLNVMKMSDDAINTEISSFIDTKKIK